MPDSIEIFDGVFGLSIRSSRSIIKGTLIDSAVSFCFIDNCEYTYSLFLNEKDPPVPLHSFTNTLYYTDAERVCNGYIGYLNHSCMNSNVYFQTSNQFGFAVIASRDIEMGEELTSNYLLFDYTCHGHCFMCTCGSINCYGNIKGFKFLDHNFQERLLGEVTENVLHAYYMDRYAQETTLNGFKQLQYEESFSSSPLLSSLAGPKSMTVVSKINEITIQRILQINLLGGGNKGLEKIVPESVFYVATFVLLMDKVHSYKGLYHCRTHEGESVYVNTCSDTDSLFVVLRQLASQSDGPPLRIIKHFLNVKEMNVSEGFDFKCRCSSSNSQVSLPVASDLWLVLTNDYHLEWHHSSKYDTETMHILDDAYQHLLQQVVDYGYTYSHSNTDTKSVDVTVPSLQLIPESVHTTLVHTWNNTLKPMPQKYVFEYVELHAQRNPYQIALASHTTQVTYQELRDEIHTLATVLQAFGVVSEEIIGVMLPRNCALIIALLGILKSGAAYTAVLYDFPEARLQYILQEDCRTKNIVTVSEYASKFTWFTGRLIFIDKLATYRQTPWINTLELSHLAYITYTSGSTGTPKGIMVEHIQLNQYTQQDVYNIDTEVYLHSTNITFDIVALEIYLPLVHNKCVYVVDSLLDPNIPANVGFLQGPSSLLEAAAFMPDATTGPTVISQIGEKLSEKVLEKYCANMNEDDTTCCSILNGYGTAETVNISVCRDVSLPRTCEDHASLPPVASDKLGDSTYRRDGLDLRVLGRPQTFTWIYVLSADRTLLPINVIGKNDRLLD